jgi:hypothetical protein
MLNFLTILVFCRQFIKKIFGNKDYHSIYRSFYCMFITIFSFSETCIHWDELKKNPLLEADTTSLIINNFMFVYMIYDIWYFFYSKKIRYDLLFHHIICLIGFYYYKKYFFLTFGSMAEIISSLNWLSLINNKFTNFTRLFRMFSIILVRLPMWLITITLFKTTNFVHLSLFFMILFILLDIYWLKVIYKNMNDSRGNNYIKKNKCKTITNDDVDVDVDVDDEKVIKTHITEEFTCSTNNESIVSSSLLCKLPKNNQTSTSFYVKK